MTRERQYLDAQGRPIEAGRLADAPAPRMVVILDESKALPEGWFEVLDAAMFVEPDAMILAPTGEKE